MRLFLLSPSLLSSTTTGRRRWRAHIMSQNCSEDKTILLHTELFKINRESHRYLYNEAANQQLFCHMHPVIQWDYLGISPHTIPKTAKFWFHPPPIVFYSFLYSLYISVLLPHREKERDNTLTKNTRQARFSEIKLNLQCTFNQIVIFMYGQKTHISINITNVKFYLQTLILVPKYKKFKKPKALARVIKNSPLIAQKSSIRILKKARF